MSNAIESTLVESRVFPPPARAQDGASIAGLDAYKALTQQVERDADEFWRDLANEHLVWNKPFSQVLDESNAPFYKWFADGDLNVSANCLDKHVRAGRGD